MKTIKMLIRRQSCVCVCAFFLPNAKLFMRHITIKLSKWYSISDRFIGSLFIFDMWMCITTECVCTTWNLLIGENRLGDFWNGETHTKRPEKITSNKPIEYENQNILWWMNLILFFIAIFAFYFIHRLIYLLYFVYTIYELHISWILSIWRLIFFPSFDKMGKSVSILLARVWLQS